MQPGARSAPAADRKALAGLVERVTFHNPENGFCVLRIKADGQRDLVTVVGDAAMLDAREWITAFGEWVNGHQCCDVDVGGAASAAKSRRCRSRRAAAIR